MRFFPSKIRLAIKKKVDEKLTNFKYDQMNATNLASELVQQIREMLKRGVEDVRIPRYKLLVQCVIGELKGQGLRIMSQCLWDDKLDNYADCTFTKVARCSPRTTTSAP